MKNRTKLAIFGLVATSSSAAFGEDLQLLGRSREEKGYAKRDRVLTGSMMSVAPSQLHEVYGPRIDAGFEYNTGKYKADDNRAVVTSPAASFSAAVGGDILVLGLSGSVKEKTVDKENVDAFEQSRITKFAPVAAMTFGDHVTVGANYEVSRIEMTQEASGQESNYFLPYDRLGASVAFHNSKFEIGLTYNGNAKASATADNKSVAATDFGLALPQTSDDRYLYIPASGGFYARGNLTDSLSLQGSVAHVQYDANHTGAIALFDKYRREDRTAGQIQAVYWFPQRSRIATTASYRGATFSPSGVEDNGLGYRLANTYGLNVDGAVKIADRTYAGAFVGYNEGARNELVNEVTYKANETQYRFGANFSKNF